METANIRVDDMVYSRCTDGTFQKFKVIGIGEDRFVNGTNVLGIPFINKYNGMGDYSCNINNYITEKTVRRI